MKFWRMFKFTICMALILLAGIVLAQCQEASAASDPTTLVWYPGGSTAEDAPAQRCLMGAHSSQPAQASPSSAPTGAAR